MGNVELNQGGITYSSGDFTVPSAGVYLIFYTINWADNTTGTRNSNFIINNSLSVRRARVNFGGGANGGQGLWINASDVVSLSANDAVKLIVWQDSGGILNCCTDSLCRIGVVKLF